MRLLPITPLGASLYPQWQKELQQQTPHTSACHSYRFWGLVHETTIIYHIAHTGFSPWRCMHALSEPLLLQLRKALSIPVSFLNEGASSNFSADRLQRQQGEILARRPAE